MLLNYSSAGPAVIFMTTQNTTPTTENKTAGTVNKIIGAASGGIVELAEALAIAQCSWLGWPGVKQIWEAIFQFIAGKFTAAFQIGATFKIIDGQVDGELKNVSKELLAIAAAEKSGNADAIKKAIQEYANANSALIHSDGSARPT